MGPKRRNKSIHGLSSWCGCLLLLLVVLVVVVVLLVVAIIIIIVIVIVITVVVCTCVCSCCCWCCWLFWLLVHQPTEIPPFTAYAGSCGGPWRLHQEVGCAQQQSSQAHRSFGGIPPLLLRDTVGDRWRCIIFQMPHVNVCINVYRSI